MYHIVPTILDFIWRSIRLHGERQKKFRDTFLRIDPHAKDTLHSPHYIFCSNNVQNSIYVQVNKVYVLILKRLLVVIRDTCILVKEYQALKYLVSRISSTEVGKRGQCQHHRWRRPSKRCYIANRIRFETSHHWLTYRSSKSVRLRPVAIRIAMLIMMNAVTTPRTQEALQQRLVKRKRLVENVLLAWIIHLIHLLWRCNDRNHILGVRTRTETHKALTIQINLITVGMVRQQQTQRPPLREGGVPCPFPWKLHEMLQYYCPNNADTEPSPEPSIVTWNTDGTAFAVLDVPKFVQTILPRYGSTLSLSRSIMKQFKNPHI